MDFSIISCHVMSYHVMLFGIQICSCHVLKSHTMLMLAHACYLFVNSMFIFVHVLTGLGPSQNSCCAFCDACRFSQAKLVWESSEGHYSCVRAVKKLLLACWDQVIL